jgi:hypothetical protein
MEEERGPYQTSIRVNVKNLVIISDPRKLIRWDPENPQLWDTILSYNLQCAQRKQVTVKLIIYSIEGQQVMILNDSFIYPDKSGDTVNLAPFFVAGKYDPTIDAFLPLEKGLYTFDIEVIGATPYDQDSLRSKRISISCIDHQNDLTIVDSRNAIIGSYYCLCSDKPASKVYLSFYDPLLEKLDEVLGATDRGAHREALTGYLTYAGDYTIIVEAQDDHPESNKAHERRWTLPRGSKLFVQSCAHYGFTGFWDWNTDAIANKAYYELGKVVNPVNLRELCYSGWYPIHECGGVLVNKRKDHAIRKISDGLIKGTLLENSIWSWSWHVADEGLMFADETYITYDDIEELPSGSLSAIRLAVLLGCYTWDFADLFVSKGARVVVGFEGTINQVAARFWNGRFWEFLTKEGETVEQAAVKAVEWCWWFPWSGLNTLYIAGNGNETIY